jgi:pimeloyl-ACP methyl ester carboxylesterase
MPVYEADEVRINYEVSGNGPPVLLIAPGGLDSNISKWAISPWHPVERLQSQFTVVAMDQRNSGGSFAPVGPEQGWNDHLADQLGLLDHLGIERCHMLGMCIGGPYIANAMKRAPERVASAVLLQPVGINDGNRRDFYEISNAFVQGLAASTHPDVPSQTWQSYLDNMWGGEFLLTASDDEVAAMLTPMLIFMGDDNYHPQWTSRRIAKLAPNAELVEQWKDPALISQVHDQIVGFLSSHRV